MKRSVFLVLAFTLMIVFSVLIFSHSTIYSIESEDGILELRGQFRASEQVTIDVQDSVGGGVLSGSVYRVFPKRLSAGNMIMIFRPKNEFENTVYWYDADAMMWTELPSVFTQAGLIMIEPSQFGYFSLGVAQTISAPTFINMIDALQALAPAETIAYEIIAGYSIEGNPMIRIPGVVRQGACAGIISSGDRFERSMKSHTAYITVNNIVETAELSYVALWSLGSGSSCTREVLEP